MAESCIVVVDIDELQVPFQRPAGWQSAGVAKTAKTILQTFVTVIKPASGAEDARRPHFRRLDCERIDLRLLTGGGFLFLHGTTGIVDVDR